MCMFLMSYSTLCCSVFPKCVFIRISLCNFRKNKYLTPRYFGLKGVLYLGHFSVCISGKYCLMGPGGAIYFQKLATLVSIAE